MIEEKRGKIYIYISITLFSSHVENKTTASLINRKTNYSVDKSANAAAAAADVNPQYLFYFDLLAEFLSYDEIISKMTIETFD